MTQPRKIRRLSEAEYLVNEELVETRHEYLNGRLFALARSNERHNRIVSNVGSLLSVSMRGKSGTVFARDMKLRIADLHAYYYPDIMLVCRNEAHAFYMEHPCVIAEVFSPATEATDRREKLVAYQSIPELRYLFLIASHRVEMLYYFRDMEGDWASARLDSHEKLEVECGPIQASLILEEIYKGVDFG